jgi:hypothetical protein
MFFDKAGKGCFSIRAAGKLLGFKKLKEKNY